MAGNGEILNHNVIVPGTIGTSSIIPYAKELVHAGCQPDGFRVSAALAMRYDLKGIADYLRSYIGNKDTRVILDHRINGLGSIAMVEEITSIVKDSGVNAVMLNPDHINVATAYIPQLLGVEGVEVIVGSPKGREISENTWQATFPYPIEAGVRSFAVPGDNPEVVAEWHGLFDTALGNEPYSLYFEGLNAGAPHLGRILEIVNGNANIIIGSNPYEKVFTEASAVIDAVAYARQELERYQRS